jgi:hypothetical protein
LFAAAAVTAALSLPVLEAARQTEPESIPPIWPVPAAFAAAGVVAFGAHAAATGAARPRSTRGTGVVAAVYAAAAAVGVVGLDSGLVDPVVIYVCVAFGALPAAAGAGIACREWRAAAVATATAVAVAIGAPVLAGTEPVADAIVYVAVVLPGFVAGLLVTHGAPEN